MEIKVNMREIRKILEEDFDMWEKGTNINIIKNWLKKRKEN